jgi:hypothetical protein
VWRNTGHQSVMLRTQRARARQWGQSCWRRCRPFLFTDTRMRKFLPALLSDLSRCSSSRTFVVSFRERQRGGASIAQWHVYSILPSQYNDNKYCNHRDFSLVVFRYESRCQYRGVYMFACRCTVVHRRCFVIARPVWAAVHALAYGYLTCDFLLTT